MNTLVLALAIGFQVPKQTPAQIESALLATLDKYFWDSKHDRWRETVGKDDRVFLWGYSVLLSTFAIGTKVEPAIYKPRLEKAFEGLQRYWTTKAPGAYAVSPGQNPRNPDRYYDDNAWVGLAAMEAYDATKNVKYLSIAKKVIAYLRSGEDTKLGGGIYWHENKKESKNACINAPAAMLAYQLFLVTKEATYQTDGDRWFDWTEKLADNDLLIMDNMNLSGVIDRTKWSYNSACFLEAACLRSEIANKELSSPGASPGISKIVQVREASIKRWLKSDQYLVDGPGMFAMHLFEALATANNTIGALNQIKNPGSREFPAMSKYVASIYENCRNEDGLLGEAWDRKPKPKEQLKLMFTASLLRTSLVARRR